MPVSTAAALPGIGNVALAVIWPDAHVASLTGATSALRCGEQRDGSHPSRLVSCRKSGVTFCGSCDHVAHAHGRTSHHAWLASLTFGY